MPLSPAVNDPTTAVQVIDRVVSSSARSSIGRTPVWCVDLKHNGFAVATTLANPTGMQG